MRRLLRTPSNPDAFGRILAALRVYGGFREAANDKERKIQDTLMNQGVSVAAVKRMVGRFEATPNSARKTLLGAISAPDFVPPSTAAAAPVPASPNASIPPVSLSVFLNAGAAAGNFADTATTDVDPVYTVRYQGIFCQEETSWDGLSDSDEIYVISSAVHISSDGQNSVRTERHPVGQSSYDDVDSGETRLGPVAAVWNGNTEVVSVTAVVFEHDFGDPDKYKEDIDALVKLGLAALVAVWPPLVALEALSGTISDAINWVLDTGDDVVETQTVVLPKSRLEEFAGTPPSFYNHLRPVFPPITTNLMHHFLTRHRGGGATYICGFDIDRKPPLPRDEVFL